jgi:transcriptional regulator with XRE-family HTH domain
MLFHTHQDKLAQLGESVQTARKLRSLTQNDLAKRAGVTRQAVSSIEKGGSSKTETLVALLFVLGLDQKFLDSIKLQNDDVGLRLSRLKLPAIVKRKKVSGDDF